MTAPRYDVLVLSVLLVLLILLAICTAFLMIRARRAAKKEEQEDSAQKAAESKAEQKLPSIFVRAMSALRERVSGPEYRYEVPWYVMLGAAGSGKTSLLTSSELSVLLEEDGQSFPGETPVGWKFYGEGMVLDPGGEWTFPEHGKSSPYWKRLLRLLNQYRPERPLEGIVITLAVTDLFGPTALDGSSLSKRAIALNERLQEARNILGFRLPVYFVLTKCDQVPGFVEFVKELGTGRLCEIFGWSSPYSLDALFEERWVEEAFENIRQTVEELQDKIFLRNGYSEGRQNMFILPDYLRVMARPLAPFLMRALKSSGGEGSFALRGIYVVGEHQQRSAEAPAPPASREQLLPSNHYPELSMLPSLLNTWHRENSNQVAFVHDLFVKKIFPEGNLAQPVGKLFYARNRFGVALQVTTIVTFFVLLIGTIVGFYRLRQNAAALTPILGKIATDLQPSADGGSRYSSTEDFLIHLASFQATGFRFLFLPSSWTGHLDKQIRSALVPTFRILVLEHFHDGLAEKARQITSLDAIPLSSVPESNSSMAKGITDVTVLPEYIQLHVFTQQLQELEKNIALYQRIATVGGSANAPTVFAIEKYLYAQDQSIGISEAENPYFEEALAKAHFKPFVILQADRENASQKMTNLTSALFSAWIGNNPVRRSLDSLGDQIQQAQGASTVTYNQLKDLRQAFHSAQTTFDSPALQWVAKDNFEMPAQLYATTIVPLQRSMYLNADLTNWVTYDAERRFTELQNAIAHESSDITGPLVAVTDDQKFVFSDNTDNVRLALDNLLALPFLAGNSNKSLATPLPDSRIVWNTALLQNAAKLPEAYQDYVSSDLEDSSPKQRNFFVQIAQKRLQQAIETEIAQAEVTSPQVPRTDFHQDIEPEVQSFASSGDALAVLLLSLREQGFNDLYYKLLHLTTNQAGTLLADLDSAFAADGAYNLPAAAFDQWVGTTPPTEAILDARSSDDVAAYLAQQRDEVRAYSQAAAPLLRFLAQEPTHDSPGRTAGSINNLINKWKSISAALALYDKKSPANSLAALESFVSTDMDKIVPSQMCPQLPARSTTYSGDYFVRVRLDLRADVYRRCRAIASFNLARDYRDLETTFNTQLAGHFPFATAALVPQSPGADPHAVSAFYQKFDAKASLIQGAIRQIDAGSSEYQDASLFLDRMTQVRSFFPVAGAPDAVALPSLDFEPSFRVNQSREVDGDQILAWTLTVGSDVFRSGDPPHLGHWVYGQPVTLTLQWAKDAPSLPLKGSPSGDASVSGPVIRFQFNDSWAFLSMLARHAASPSQVQVGKDTSPFVLQFQTYETAPGPHRTGAAITGPVVASVFMQMNVFPPGGKQPMQQAAFPTEAVDLPSSNTNTAKAGGQ
jgi:type VI secretion system protein ImpL